MVELRLHGSLRRFAADSSPLGESILWMRWEEADTVERILRRAGIDPQAEVSNVFVNGRYEVHALAMPIQEGWRLGVFPKNMGLLYC